MIVSFHSNSDARFAYRPFKYRAAHATIGKNNRRDMSKESNVTWTFFTARDGPGSYDEVMVTPEMLEILRCPLDPNREARLVVEDARLFCRAAGSSSASAKASLLC